MPGELCGRFYFGGVRAVCNSFVMAGFSLDPGYRELCKVEPSCDIDP